MPEWVEIIITVAPGLLAAGALWVRVSRLERDVDARVSRELFDVHVKHVEASLAEIKALLLARHREGE